jgi:hypothetical protein
MESKFENFLIVREMFDTLPQVQVTWTPPLTNNKETQYFAQFKVGEVPYYVGFKLHSDPNVDYIDDYYIAWDVERGALPAIDQLKLKVGDGRFERTKLGDKKGTDYTLEVLGSVISVLKEFITTVQPTVLTYIPGDKELKRLYILLSKKFADSIGYRRAGWALVRKDKANKANVVSYLHTLKSKL